MSDLISRSELLESFRKSYCGHLGMENSDVMITFRSICRIINEQPTAYDVDKVVEKLETDSYAIMLDGALVASKEVVVDAKRATEIVKQGGVSNTSGEREIARLCDYAIAENMILTGKP